MSVAIISLCALVGALVVSCVSDINVGILSIVAAWLVGVYVGGMRIEEVLAGFPTSLFVTLVALTLLFSQAQANGALDRVARQAVRLCRGQTGLVPLMFFALTAMLSSIGPGNIGATALMAPLGMAVAGRYGIPPFLMAIMIANGASAGSLSPIAPTGAIVNSIVTKMGVVGAEWTLYLNNLVVHTVVGFAGYFLLGGAKLFARAPRGEVGAVGSTSVWLVRGTSGEVEAATVDDEKLLPKHRLTLAVIAALVVATIAFKINVGMAALCGALLLTLARAGDERQAIKLIPWNVILMVSGVTVLVALVEKTGGLELFAGLIARVATPATSTLVTAFFTGLISIYSSTTGVVLPAMLPMVPSLIEKMGGGDLMSIVSSINTGGHLVDVSPLSTLGALCLAAVPAGTDTRKLFNQLMAWGLSMCVIGGLVCWLVFGVL